MESFWSSRPINMRMFTRVVLICWCIHVQLYAWVRSIVYKMCYRLAKFRNKTLVSNFNFQLNRFPFVYCQLTTDNLHLPKPAPIAQLIECPLRGTRRHGFDPGPRHTKVVKIVTSCSSLGTQTYGVKLGVIDPVSG